MVLPEASYEDLKCRHNLLQAALSNSAYSAFEGIETPISIRLQTTIFGSFRLSESREGLAPFAEEAALRISIP